VAARGRSEDLDDVERSVRMETERLCRSNWTARFGMARVLHMSDHHAEGTVQPESGLTDEHFSPIWVDDDRPRIPRVAAEREALVAYLEYYRATVDMKSRGVTPEQARTRSVPPSTLSLHGLVRHLAGVERWWFQQNFERRARPLDWYEDVDLRWLVLRMITEYAQHCGHVDLLREAIDGRAGA
jgi:hypothetical protein